MVKKTVRRRLVEELWEAHAKICNSLLSQLVQLGPLQCRWTEKVHKVRAEDSGEYGNENRASRRARWRRTAAKARESLNCADLDGLAQKDGLDKSELRKKWRLAAQAIRAEN
ncbi:Oidioi.mRNA.OKI2018_I69.XSR.g16250.t1.cds [Oikopleura dioica]|uniref:Oidioi.mRNA.OKI2018_I69.XSR.g16250.t1.cds n=1 Tax=Oikopleura dioica TaxID=34765 RepID=A0ABN7SFI2_OIKDI|nr:Oidioi.mRNA.OKI2018_I69.XSR.g16250.t1.cds [Oikopleura dioica]